MGCVSTYEAGVLPTHYSHSSVPPCSTSFFAQSQGEIDRKTLPSGFRSSKVFHEIQVSKNRQYTHSRNVLHPPRRLPSMPCRNRDCRGASLHERGVWLWRFWFRLPGS